MTTILKWLNKHFVLLIILTVAGALVDLALLGLWFRLNSTEWAAWVQAIGSMAAVGVAIWIMGEQHRTAARRQLVADELDLRNFLKAIRSEIATFRSTLRNIDQDMIQHALQIDLTGRFESQYPQTTPSFPVYEATAASLGKIADDVLRREIIGTYAELRAFFDGMNRNSDYLERWDRSDTAQNQIKDGLNQMGQHLRNQLDDLIKLVNQVDDALKNATTK